MNTLSTIAKDVEKDIEKIIDTVNEGSLMKIDLALRLASLALHHPYTRDVKNLLKNRLSDRDLNAVFACIPIATHLIASTTENKKEVTSASINLVAQFREIDSIKSAWDNSETTDDQADFMMNLLMLPLVEIEDLPNDPDDILVLTSMKVDYKLAGSAVMGLLENNQKAVDFFMSKREALSRLNTAG